MCSVNTSRQPEIEESPKKTTQGQRRGHGAGLSYAPNRDGYLGEDSTGSRAPPGTTPTEAPVIFNRADAPALRHAGLEGRGLRAAPLALPQARELGLCRWKVILKRSWPLDPHDGELDEVRTVPTSLSCALGGVWCPARLCGFLPGRRRGHVREKGCTLSRDSLFGVANGLRTR